ncbi:MAG TPA: phage tail protein [Kofleriaceae bacterium]|jgi:phage tail-like protein
MDADDWRYRGPLFPFNFDVVFTSASITPAKGGAPPPNVTTVRLCNASFSEVSGLEATMEPKVIKEGGRNYGTVQRVGPVTFATVVLKRGISGITDLYTWFDLVSGGAYANRMTATITLYGPDRGDSPSIIYQWTLLRAMPTKFKTADFNATASAVGIEELHIVHEGMQQVPGS